MRRNLKPVRGEVRVGDGSGDKGDEGEVNCWRHCAGLRAVQDTTIPDRVFRKRKGGRARGIFMNDGGGCRLMKQGDPLGHPDRCECVREGWLTGFQWSTGTINYGSAWWKQEEWVCKGVLLHRLGRSGWTVAAVGGQEFAGSLGPLPERFDEDSLQTSPLDGEPQCDACRPDPRQGCDV